MNGDIRSFTENIKGWGQRLFFIPGLMVNLTKQLTGQKEKLRVSLTLRGKGDVKLPIHAFSFSESNSHCRDTTGRREFSKG